ncbi:MAG: hypothetical protein K0R54_1803 [Clostridiaceae bacterium]|jgi:NACalpha-BTF3-like transcription factor|nr:hypothetical protein [Clostridiaceae bacterium]
MKFTKIITIISTSLVILSTGVPVTIEGLELTMTDNALINSNNILSIKDNIDIKLNQIVNVNLFKEDDFKLISHDKQVKISEQQSLSALKEKVIDLTDELEYLGLFSDGEVDCYKYKVITTIEDLLNTSIVFVNADNKNVYISGKNSFLVEMK